MHKEDKLDLLYVCLKWQFTTVLSTLEKGTHKSVLLYPFLVFIQFVL